MLESEGTHSYSYSSTVGAREDTDRDVCHISQQIHPSVKRDRRTSYVSLRTRLKIQSFKTRKPRMFSNGPQY